MHRLGARGRRSAESHARQAKGRLYLLQVNHDETRRNCVQVLHLQHASSHHALPLRLLLAEGGAGAPHLEDVEAAARQQQNFSLCKNALIQFLPLGGKGGGGGGGELTSGNAAEGADVNAADDADAKDGAVALRDSGCHVTE